MNILAILNGFGQKNKPNSNPKKTQFYLAPSTVGGLKKQSQFVPGKMNVIAYIQGIYSIILTAGIDENKASQTCPEPVERSQLYAPVLDKGAKQTSEVWGRMSDFGYPPLVVYPKGSRFVSRRKIKFLNFTIK